MTPFYRWGSTASRLVPLRGGSLLFIVKFPDIPGIRFIDLGRMKGWVDLGAAQWLWIRDLWIGNPAPQSVGHCSKYSKISSICSKSKKNLFQKSQSRLGTQTASHLERKSWSKVHETIKMNLSLESFKSKIKGKPERVRRLFTKYLQHVDFNNVH